MPRALPQRRNGEGNLHKHHCTICGGKAVTSRCLKLLHVAYCEVETCGRLFQVRERSGCNFHPYAEGFNVEVKKEFKGRDPDSKTAFELEQEAAEREREEEKARKEQEERERRIETEYDKDWKKEDAKKKDKVPRPTKKEKKGKKNGNGNAAQ